MSGSIEDAGEHPMVALVEQSYGDELYILQINLKKMFHKFPLGINSLGSQNFRKISLGYLRSDLNSSSDDETMTEETPKLRKHFL